MVFVGHADVGQGSMNKASELRIRGMERVTGIEPALSAWESVHSGPSIWPDLRSGLSVSGRESPRFTRVNGPLMARLLDHVESRPSANFFQAGHIPSWRGSHERYALSPVADACRWLLLLLSPLLSAAVWVTTRTVQGMARVRSGQAPAWPLSSDRSVRRGSGVKRDFACTFTRHLPPVLVVLRSQSRLNGTGLATAAVRSSGRA
jgi:hypothetical protein